MFKSIISRKDDRNTNPFDLSSPNRNSIDIQYDENYLYGSQYSNRINVIIERGNETDTRNPSKNTSVCNTSNNYDNALANVLESSVNDHRYSLEQEDTAQDTIRDTIRKNALKMSLTTSLDSKFSLNN